MIGAPVTGYLADRSSSRKRIFLGGLALLLVSVIAFSFGRTFTLLVAGRFVQGLSAASVHATGTALLADIYAHGGIGFIMGVLDFSMALGTVAGPVMGGLIYQELGYNAVFRSAYVVIAADILLRLLMSEGRHHCEQKADDRDSSEGLLTNGRDSSEVSSVSGGDQPPPFIADTTDYGINAPPKHDHAVDTSYTHPPSQIQEHSSLKPSKSPIKKLRQSQIVSLLLSPRMQTSLLADFLQSVIITGLETTLPLHITSVFDYNSKQIALIFLIISFPSVISPLIGHLGDRLGPKSMITFAMLVLGPFLIALRFIHHKTLEQLVVLCALLFFIGLSLNLILTPAFLDVTYLVDDMAAERPGGAGEKKGYAKAYGLMGFAYACGSLVGPLLGGLERTVGWNALTLSVGLFCVLCVPPCFLYLRGKRPKAGLELD